MSTPVAGWYPDPSGAAPLRWWSGAGWTQDTHLAPSLATWGERVRGYLVDAVGLWIFSFVVLSPFHRTFSDELTGILTSTLLTGEGGLPSLGTLWDYGIFSLWIATAVPGVVARVVYDLLTTTRRGATFGHSNAGVRVVEAARPGVVDGIGLRAALVRSLVVRCCAPLVFPWLLVVLWPLWDSEKRSLADLAAGTRVVVDPARQWWG